YSPDIFRSRNPIQLDKKWYQEENANMIRRLKETKFSESDKNKRHTGFNLHDLFYRGSIELRYHSGTVQAEKILNWTSLLLHMVDYSINRYNSTKIQRLYNMETGESKLDQMFYMFDIPSNLQEYIRGRIKKFNPE